MPQDAAFPSSRRAQLAAGAPVTPDARTLTISGPSRRRLKGWGMWACLTFVILAPRPAIAADEIALTTATVTPGLITAEDIRPHIETLASPAFAGRGHEGKPAARSYIVSAFQQTGARPLFDGEWFQIVPGQLQSDGQPGPGGANIGALIVGSDPELREEWLLVNAHYDHLGVRKGKVYPGADDNASGVAMLIEVARRLSKNPPRRSVALVAFDFEESLLWGSRWFAAHPPAPMTQFRACLTADMIGRSLGDLDLPLVFVMGAEHSPQLQEAVATVSPPPGLEIAQLGADMVGTRSDYAPFRDQQVPFLFFSTGEHPDYHTPRDTPDRIEYEKCARVCTLIGLIARTLADADAAPEWTAANYRPLEEARVLNQVSERILEAHDLDGLELSSMQKFFVSQLVNKTRYIERRQRVSLEERKWMVRAAQVLLISVF